MLTLQQIIKFRCTSTKLFKSGKCNCNIFQRWSSDSTGKPAQSSFVAPERLDVKQSLDDLMRKPVEGREDGEVFSEEYVAPQVMTDWHANKLFHRLVRMDCLQRRQVIKIPEFYPGSIIAVTYADQHAPDHTMRFIGRCIYKDGFGIGAYFCLRNIIEGEAQEIEFQMYDPMIQKYELIRLEKWIDTDLRYLRDADPTICTIDFNQIQEAPPPKSEPLPVFKGKVKMDKTKKYWSWKYDRAWPRPYNCYFEEHLVQEDVVVGEKIAALQSWRKYDICRHNDYIEQKKEIMKEMEINKLRLNKRAKDKAKKSSS